ncbi:sensor histidine kinase [Roseobacter ponti]|uniref:histidine kinase n=1 Tax=Roseobacter ponti TaxID=1891787 RepID=A0A858SZM8_9RHOB|nr:sensor histidine kinase [Roseobacter ponti]QJF53342.1 sensor histidine kinase [Roseobacter ponti]
MTGGFLDGDIFRGLAFRILVFLSLALLPFGLISVVQTRELAEQAVRNAETSLIGLTERAAGAERTIIQEAFGSADAISSFARAFIAEPEVCSDFLARYIETEDRYSQIGFVGTDGVMSCTSAGGVHDYSDDPAFQQVLLNPRRTVRFIREPAISGKPVLLVLRPVFEGDILLGFMTMSIPRAAVDNIVRPEPERLPFGVIVFNQGGEVVLSSPGDFDAELNQPLNRSLTALIGEKPSVFTDENNAGETRVYSVVSIVPDVAYSMAVWRSDDLIASTDRTGRLSLFLPVMMWLASLVVAFWSINRLAIRHIRKLSRQMRLFAYNRRMPRNTLGHGVPRELQEIQQSFVNMAGSIIRDEASLEDNIRDKNILLKEVHHRVKNNLQLISSIMNMQIRRARTEDARFVLKRLQDRILSLATVHKNLYQSERLDRVDAGALIKEIVQQLLVVGLPAGSGIKVNQHYDQIMLDADDAAPLTLTVSEAVTNAMKYINEPGQGGTPQLDITFAMSGDDAAVFTISNTTPPDSGTKGTGLGSQLINAFARQLNGGVEVFHEDGLHRLVLTFPLSQRDLKIHDY